MFHVPGFASGAYEVSARSALRQGLPHSEISGSKAICASPKHIAAYHVLHRLLTPSHPPFALRSLTLMSTSLFSSQPCLIAPLSWQDLTVLTIEVVTSYPSFYEIVKEQKLFMRASLKSWDLSGLEPLTPCLQSRCSTN